ncbi:EscU/YscU/HrcU family type III secretion system export apparatus switch protein [Sulfurimonas sp.]|jgi:flagellar biosynthesis protein|uniref:EscU/YscU/HrcU family type III secretion system export apparatus switch protein n=1 Tax=Sulfurimonas sp. TaxID=2022749 RepID=UPI001BC30D1C|nr:EscU/YscU/HrcU family type III secretion system export apparatus switch protein [Sulfurimonas sp.]MBS4068849.1 EscU/YscU/HrcU family type III secretion system export apparatus switch protein [Sulfurimonas sp.]MDD3854489.1 EscU/YscU/HrcU family type III secretion system export apparatus switch protein [Sulfurimonas sp.]MDX9755902.1 EscU/YscU/HrcU family type III secretion system export apparatus switch protein [Sulfurimonas sp.]
MKKAAALRYDATKERAPRVVAKGEGQTAENIIKIAELHNLPIRKDEDLIELLSKVELDKEVPEALYKVVAEVFSFIYKVSKKEVR